MRRLAVQTRDDAYTSARDYQTIHGAQGFRVAPAAHGEQLLALNLDVDLEETGFLAIGGYVRPSRPVRLALQLAADEEQASEEFDLPAEWTRIGVVVECDEGVHTAGAVLAWDRGLSLDIWGLTIGEVALPEVVDVSNDLLRVLKQGHLVPETFYLDHAAALDLTVDAEASSLLHLADGAEIKLKKCSYCSRLLPLDPDRLGALAFHKHNAKRTKHQNECRACKTWRINKHFNPIRTTDQLHESSAITRERKLLLREPEILQAIKERTGAGLKSQVWGTLWPEVFLLRASSHVG